ncbi:glycoside hydrolase family 19 protein [Azospirillum thermophilum]|uniref:Glycoside hydrolase family 19 n=1 Tax=Azospirillum thermophilum TaxID=2202148 RepID=A0A2S2CSF8_9PROT|nr:glycoside hydrolase family 19 protein [Azospirillum thermophilum]AWK87310.1 glycoside hydrolase family 19 [Azospirillum thermophilum]
MIDVAALATRAAPRLHPDYLDALRRGGPLLDRASLTTPLRIAHFLAQVLHETAGGTLLFENLTYTTADRLLAIFGQGRHSAAIRVEEAPALLRNPRALAERVYGLGNPAKARVLGNSRPGDGWLYRGGGLLQATGGANYRRMGELCGVDFHGTPELIAAPDHALKPALRIWREGDLNDAADRDDLRAITRTINGGLTGEADRRRWFDRIRSLMAGGPSSCLPVAAATQADASKHSNRLQQ